MTWNLSLWMLDALTVLDTTQPQLKGYLKELCFPVCNHFYWNCPCWISIKCVFVRVCEDLITGAGYMLVWPPAVTSWWLLHSRSFSPAKFGGIWSIPPGKTAPFRSHQLYKYVVCKHGFLGGGFNDFSFSPLGKVTILTNIFQRGWNHQLGMVSNLAGTLYPKLPKVPIMTTSSFFVVVSALLSERNLPWRRNKRKKREDLPCLGTFTVGILGVISLCNINSGYLYILYVAFQS